MENGEHNSEISMGKTDKTYQAAWNHSSEFKLL